LYGSRAKRFKHRFWIVAPREHPHRTLDFAAARVSAIREAGG